MLTAIDRKEQARDYYYSKALEIQARLETEPLTDAERQKLERSWKLHRKFWRHHAKVASQLREREKHLNR